MEELVSPPGMDFGAAYYDPPRVKWWWLLAAYVIMGVLVAVLIPHNYQDILQCLLGWSWPIYFGIWLRRVDPQSKSLFWIAGGVLAGAISGILAIPDDPSQILQYTAEAFGLISGVSSLVSIYVIRAELMRHYNEREGFSLHLGPVMTFFFSFLYFQYHLYGIAESRRLARGAVTL